MKIDKREEEKQSWAGYGTAERPVVVMYYFVEDEHGAHRILSINDYAVWDLFGNQAIFELHLAARYRSFEFVGSGKAIVKPADQTTILPEGSLEIKRRIEELRAKYPGICSEPWMPERLNQQKVDKTEAPMAVPDDDPSAPNDSGEKSSNELLAAISKAIFDRIAPVVAGTLKREGPAELAPITEAFLWLRLLLTQLSRLLGSGPAEADVAAAVAMFPAGVRALISCRVDARVQVSRSAEGLEVSMSECNESEFLFSELSEPYNATSALHLICDPAKDAGYTYVMVEFVAGKFVPKGWVTSEEAARYGAEGAKRAVGRPPDFRRSSRKSPKGDPGTESRGFTK